MTKTISFTAYVDSETIADECAANPPLFAEILHFVARRDGEELCRIISEATDEARDVYDAVAIGYLMRLMADRIEASHDLPQNSEREDVVVVRPAAQIENGVPISPVMEDG